MTEALRESPSATFRALVVECRFLGGAELLVDRAPAAVDTRKAVALVAYLAVEGRCSRDRLAALLWPESDDTHARSTLRRTLSALRSGLGGDVVIADRSAISLNPDVATDLAGFRAAMEATTGHEHAPHDVCPECLPHLDRASSLYRGDFLAGFSVRDAPDFDDWARTVAEGLRLELAGALERLAAGRAAVGEYRAAVDAAARWVELDPLHEPAHRNLMLLAAWAGDRPRAIDAYRRCVSVLSEELGVAPLEETSDLHEAILADDLPPPPGPRRRVQARVPEAVAARRGESLIGRSGQLEALERSLMWAATGGRVVLLTGDPWMGKTRVLEEFVASAAERGHRTLLARGYRAERELPYGVVVQLLQAAHAAGWQSREVPDWALAEASRLVPDIASSEPPLDGLGETRLHDAVSLLLVAYAGGRPLVVGIDDGQWIDDASVSLLSYLTRRLGDAGVLLVVALPADAYGTPSSLAIREMLGNQAVDVHLAPLAAADLVGIVEDETEAAAIVAATGGVPLLVAERVARRDTETSVRRYIDTRLSGLGGLGSQVVSAAAVLDGACDVDLLCDTSGRTIEEVVDAVEDLIRSGILREVPGTRGHLGFALDAMEQVAYDAVAPVRRRLLHGRAADALAERPGAGRDPRSATAVANHLLESGREAEAVGWFVTAGDLAASVYAHAEAEAAYASALAIADDGVASIRLRLGEVHLARSRYADAIEAFRIAAALGDAAVTACAEHSIGDVQRRLGHFDQAEHHFRLAEPGHPDPFALYSDWSLLEHRRGNRERAAELAERSVELAVASSDRRAEARARNILGIVTEDPSQVERALGLAGDDPALRMACLNSLAFAVARDGDIERGVDLLGEALDLADRVGDRHRRAALYNHLADLHHRAGRSEASQAALTEAVRLFAEVQPGGWEPEVWLLSRW